MTDQVYKIAIIGCGGVSRMHLDGYTAHPERVNVVALCDADPGNLADKSDRYGIAQTCASVDDLLAHADFEVGIVCTPTPVREPIIQQLADAGKHIFVEKPMADTLAEARRLVAICEQANVQLAVDQNFRCFYPFCPAKGLIAEDHVGSIISITHRDLMFRQDKGWRLTCKRHALSVMGVHWLDGFRWMLGEEPKTISAHTASSPAIDCAGDTDAQVWIEFPGGATVTYTQSFSSAFNHCQTIVIGETGTIVFDYHGLHLYKPVSRDPAEYMPQTLLKPESAFALLDELLIALDTETEPTNSGRDNFNTIALLDAAYASAEHGCPVQPQIINNG